LFIFLQLMLLFACMYLSNFLHPPQAFVHDPLINWRLFNFNEVPQVPNYGNANGHTVVSSEEASTNRELLQPHRGVRERELLQVLFFHIHDCLITCKISYVQNLATTLE
jgi:hypothetical protein